MLDIKFIRENTNIIKEAIRKKRLDFNLEKFLSLDKERKSLLQDIEQKRARQNLISQKIPSIFDSAEKSASLEILKNLKDDIHMFEEQFKSKDYLWKKALLEIPNVPDPSVPEGESDADNVEIRKWGKVRKFIHFPPKDHITLMKGLDMLDTERGAKVSGFRGYFLKNDAVKIFFALSRLVFDFLNNKGFETFMAPALAKPENFTGTGWLPQGEEEVYKIQDGLYLAGTAEVPMMGFNQGEIFEEDELPKKYAAISWCFRREAGSYGKDTNGLFRVHEFIKIEQIILCKASHEESVYLHEEITKNSEEIMQQLGIPYRVVLNCGADLGLGQVKKYDIEAWVPSERKYRETHSSSYFHDFQSRRLNIRYKDKEGKIRFVHSLNNTAAAMPRLIIPLLENHQQDDGTVYLPSAIRKHL